MVEIQGAGVQRKSPESKVNIAIRLFNYSFCQP